MRRPILCSGYRSRARRGALLLASMLALLVSPDLRAQESHAGAEQRAIEIGRTALDHYARGAWSEALEAFRAAEELAHSPVFVLYMARCSRNLGRLLEAREQLRSVAAEQLPEDAPAPWAQAVVLAHAELGTLQQLVPSLVVRVSNRTGVTHGTIDGRPALFSGNELEIDLDPGEHTVRVGGTVRTVRLAEGRRRVPLTIELPALSQPPVVAAPPLAPEEPAAPPAPVTRVLGFVLLGTGAAALVGGIATGLVAKHKTDEITAQCRPRCPRELADDAERASDWAGVATVSFIASATALASGGALLLLSPSTEQGARVTLSGRF